jgi:hypothetical protein
MADITITNSTPSPSPAGPFKKHQKVTITNNGPLKIRLMDFTPPVPPLFSEPGYTIDVGQTISPEVIAVLPPGKHDYHYGCPPDSAAATNLTDGGGIIIVDGGGPMPGPKKPTPSKASAKPAATKPKTKPKAKPKTKPKAKPKGKGKAKGGKKTAPKRKAGKGRAKKK